MNLREWDIKDWQQDVWGHLSDAAYSGFSEVSDWFWGRWDCFYISLVWMSSFLRSFLQFMSSARTSFTAIFLHHYLLSIQLCHFSFSLLHLALLFLFCSLFQSLSSLNPRTQNLLIIINTSSSISCTFKYLFFVSRSLSLIVLGRIP